MYHKSMPFELITAVPITLCQTANVLLNCKLYTATDRFMNLILKITSEDIHHTDELSSCINVDISVSKKLFGTRLVDTGNTKDESMLFLLIKSPHHLYCSHIAN